MGLVFNLVTPEECLFTGEVQEVILPASGGQMGILPGHIPFLIEIEAGAVQVKQLGQEDRFFAVDQGLAQVKGQRLMLLSQAALPLEKINLLSAKEQQAFAERALRSQESQHFNPDKVCELESMYRFAFTQQEIFRQYPLSREEKKGQDEPEPPSKPRV